MDGATLLVDPMIWQSGSCKLGWDVMGVFPPGADGTDINNVCVNFNNTMVAAADDFATMAVYRYPCMKNSQDCRRLSGHAEHVTRVKFFEQYNEKTG